jgi:ABC-type uncharacterized transport system ATPase subunit
LERPGFEAGPLLEVADLDVYYGKSHILRDVSFAVGRGEIVALLGRNGAGKTTALRTVVGLLRPTRGAVRLRGADPTWPGSGPSGGRRWGWGTCPRSGCCSGGSPSRRISGPG